MKKIIYMVKINPKLPNNPDNWFLFSGSQFKEYISSNDMTGRYFTCLGGEEHAPEIIIAECTEEKYREWNREYERHKYLRKIEKDPEIIIFLESQILTDNDMRNYEDIYTIDFSSAEDEFIKRYDKHAVRNAVKKLPKRQREVIELTYFFTDILKKTVIEEIFSRRIEIAKSEAKLRGVKKITPNSSAVLTESEVAECMSISRNTVHSLKCDAIKNLKKFLK